MGDEEEEEDYQEEGEEGEEDGKEDSAIGQDLRTQLERSSIEPIKLTNSQRVKTKYFNAVELIQMNKHSLS